MAARSSAHEKAARVMDLTLRGGTPAADVRLARWRQAASRTRRGSLEGGPSPSGDCQLPVPTRPAIATSHHPLNASGRDGDDDPRRDRQV